VPRMVGVTMRGEETKDRDLEALDSINLDEDVPGEKGKAQDIRLQWDVTLKVRLNQQSAVRRLASSMSQASAAEEPAVTERVSL
jgi:hypothetical protein